MITPLKLLLRSVITLEPQVHYIDKLVEAITRGQNAMLDLRGQTEDKDDGKAKDDDKEEEKINGVNTIREGDDGASELDSEVEVEVLLRGAQAGSGCAASDRSFEGELAGVDELLQACADGSAELHLVDLVELAAVVEEEVCQAGVLGVDLDAAGDSGSASARAVVGHQVGSLALPRLVTGILGRHVFGLADEHDVAGLGEQVFRDRRELHHLGQAGAGRANLLAVAVTPADLTMSASEVVQLSDRSGHLQQPGLARVCRNPHDIGDAVLAGFGRNVAEGDAEVPLRSKLDVGNVVADDLLLGGTGIPEQLLPVDGDGGVDDARLRSWDGWSLSGSSAIRGSAGGSIACAGVGGGVEDAVPTPGLTGGEEVAGPSSDAVVDVPVLLLLEAIEVVELLLAAGAGGVLAGDELAEAGLLGASVLAGHVGIGHVGDVDVVGVDAVGEGAGVVLGAGFALLLVGLTLHALAAKRRGD